MNLISFLPTIFQLSPFSFGSFCLPSNSAVDGGYCTKGIICNYLRSLETAAGGCYIESVFIERLLA